MLSLAGWPINMICSLQCNDIHVNYGFEHDIQIKYSKHFDIDLQVVFINHEYLEKCGGQC